MIDPGLDLPVSTQCQLLGLARSTYYYESTASESDFNLALMEEIDRLYLAPGERLAHDDQGASSPGPPREPQTGPATDAVDGSALALSPTKDHHAQQGTPCLSLWSAGI